MMWLSETIQWPSFIKVSERGNPAWSVAGSAYAVSDMMSRAALNLLEEFILIFGIL